MLVSCAHEDKGVEEGLIQTNRKISEKIDQMAERADRYVANDKYVEMPNKSQIVIRNGFLFSEGGEFKYTPQLGVRLHLPNLQEKLQLRFTSYDEDAEERGINESRIQPTSAERNYGTSLAFFQQLGDVATEFRPRIEWRDELQTSYLFKFSSEAKRGTFSIEPELQLFARSDTGTGQYFGLDFHLELTPENLLTLINEEQYTDGDNTMSTNHGVRWIHQYNELISYENSVIVESNNRETYHLQRTVWSTSFRHKLRKNVLHYAVTPYLTFDKDNSYHPVTAFDLRVEIIF